MFLENIAYEKMSLSRKSNLVNSRVEKRLNCEFFFQPFTIGKKAVQLNINRVLSMGSYLNPPSARFEKLKQTKVFVDKTGIFEILNENINTENCFFLFK